MAGPGTYLRTVRHMRGEQIVGQLRRALGRGVRPRRSGGAPARLALTEPTVAFLPPAEHVRHSEAGRVRLVEREVDFPNRIDWDFGGEGPLWAYHLHQMEWLRSGNLRPDQRLAIALDWVERHRQGVGWDGGPLSLRAFHWLKLLTTPGSLPDDAAARGRLVSSLADQLATLSAHRERHLLGNHYLWNLLALVLGGVALEGGESDAWLRCEEALRDELFAQVLPDGGHEERSPMYHALLLENVLDLLNLVRATPRPVPSTLEPVLLDVAARMLGALAVLTHPDGEIALFGDAAFQIAPPPPALQSYAARLGVEPRPPAQAGVLDATGYVRLEAGPFSLLASVAGPSPPHQPGHAHCDALAFELCHGRERIVTDTGVYEYRPGPRREASRATRSHATLEVGGRDQAEVWAPHRVGGRPQVVLLDVTPGRAAEAACRGWASRVWHRRRLQVDPQGVTLLDRVDGPAAPVRLQLPLAPDVGCELEAGRATLRLADGSALRLDLPQAARWRCETAPYFPSFGIERERTLLVGEGQGPAELRWSIRRA